MLHEFKIDAREASEILISVFAISLALAIATNGLGIIFQLDKLGFLMVVFIVTVGLGFILHELSHKAAAIHYGAQAGFKMWPQGLIFMLLISLLGFVFAATGAVYIYAKNITRKEYGIISLAGPAANIAIAIVFVAFYLYLPSNLLKVNVWMLGAYINALLALFNMIPIYPLDGSKIMAWNFFVWLGTAVIAGWMFLTFGGALIP